MRGMSQAIMDLRIFQETKYMDGVYTRGLDGYSVIARDLPIPHRIRVAVFYRSSPHYALEAIQKFGPNFVGFQLAAGEQRCYIIRYYLTPNNTLTIESFVAALKECPRG